MNIPSDLASVAAAEAAISGKFAGSDGLPSVISSNIFFLSSSSNDVRQMLIAFYQKVEITKCRMKLLDFLIFHVYHVFKRTWLILLKKKNIF